MEHCLARDMISELPEALLLEIMSSLPTKQVVATSVLSKGWRSLWKMVPSLKFVSLNKEYAVNVVGRSLLLHKAPVLDSFHLFITRDTDNDGDDPYVEDIGAWLGIAFARNLRQLILDVSITFGVSFRFPNSLFCSASSSLETLILNYSILLDVPCPVTLKSLKTLKLLHVTYKDDESFRNLVSGCPNLEDLLLYQDKAVVMMYIIVSPSLKRLTIHDGSIRTTGRGYVINAPMLKYLWIKKLRGYEFFLFESAASELVEANIRNVSEVGNEMILQSLKSSKRLSLDLSPLEIKCPIGNIFYQLVRLELCTRKVEWWRLLTAMLDSSPKLQFLKLFDCQSCQRDLLYSRNNWRVVKKWSDPKFVPECLLSQLETFVWTRYDWRREEERDVATYILRNARRLKKATFSIEDLENTSDILEEFSGIVSNSCHLLCEFA